MFIITNRDIIALHKETGERLFEQDYLITLNNADEINTTLKRNVTHKEKKT